MRFTILAHVSACGARALEAATMTSQLKNDSSGKGHGESLYVYGESHMIVKIVPKFRFSFTQQFSVLYSETKSTATTTIINYYFVLEFYFINRIFFFRHFIHDVFESVTSVPIFA